MALPQTGVSLYSTGRWLIHPDFWEQFTADATARETNLGDLACRILAAHFQVPYAPSSRRSTPPSAPPRQFNIRMPDNLRRAIAAQYPGEKIADGIRYALHAHYGLRVPPQPKFTRTRRPRPAVA